MYGWNIYLSTWMPQFILKIKEHLCMCCCTCGSPEATMNMGANAHWEAMYVHEYLQSFGSESCCKVSVRVSASL